MSGDLAKGMLTVGKWIPKELKKNIEPSGIICGPCLILIAANFHDI